jgi:hypothetical protein
MFLKSSCRDIERNKNVAIGSYLTFCVPLLFFPVASVSCSCNDTLQFSL